jgi:hypothetical protein
VTNVVKGVRGFVSVPLKERFIGKYEADPNTGCWLWIGLKRKGYGYFKSGRTKLSAHRASWHVHRGTIPVGLWVLHKCDMPHCVNPEHLFLGTAGDNNADMMRKGRARLHNTGNWQKGSAHRLAKLTEDAVRQIRTRKCSAVEYANIYGVSPSTVEVIMAGYGWSHVA